jgi:hypothetical protein
MFARIVTIPRLPTAFKVQGFRFKVQGFSRIFKGFSRLSLKTLEKALIGFQGFFKDF